MPDKSFLTWPFFEDRHRVLAAAIDDWCQSHLPVVRCDVDPLDLDPFVAGSERHALDVGRERDPVDPHQNQCLRRNQTSCNSVVPTISAHENA